MRRSSIILALGLVAATGLALAYSSRDTGGSTTSTTTSSNDMQGAVEQQQDMQGGGANGQQALGPVDPNAPLPPNHPSIDPSMMGQQGMGQDPHGNMGGGAAMGNAADEPAALKWTMPKDWTQAQNPNPMRLATYKVNDAEMAVSRAGGDLKMNIARWASQFDGNPTPKETTKTVHGLKVTIVQIEGTFQGGMGPDTSSHANWAMTSAIVETSGEHYFFKLVGPSATVKGAQKSFDAMIDGITST